MNHLVQKMPITCLNNEEMLDAFFALECCQLMILLMLTLRVLIKVL